jgi:hypothetical protein
MKTEIDMPNVTFHVGNARGPGGQRNPVDRNEVHEVHQEHPDEDRQGQRRNEAALAMERVFDTGINELDDDLYKSLKLAGLARRRFLCRAAKQHDEYQPKQH